jgi:acetolactate synthase-1/2/3 large subunit
VLVVDGGDFVASAAYTVRPRGPFSWLDPGAFGTLGVGRLRYGRETGATAGRGVAAVWRRFVRLRTGRVRHLRAPSPAGHRLVGNDGRWAQIAREQVEILHDDVGTVLARTAYHRVVEGFGAVGLLLEKAEDVPAVLTTGQTIGARRHAVLINAMIGATEFRKGAVSM